jgi:hypothetical protein
VTAAKWKSIAENTDFKDNAAECRVMLASCLPRQGLERTTQQLVCALQVTGFGARVSRSNGDINMPQQTRCRSPPRYYSMTVAAVQQRQLQQLVRPW